MKTLGTHNVTPWGGSGALSARYLGTLWLSADENGKWCVKSSPGSALYFATGTVDRLDSRSETMRRAQRACEDCAAELLAADLLRVMGGEVLVGRAPDMVHWVKCARAALHPSERDAPGPRYVVVPADQVTPEQEKHAEFFASRAPAARWAHLYNTDALHRAKFAPADMPRDRLRNFPEDMYDHYAILDTRPETTEVRHG